MKNATTEFMTQRLETAEWEIKYHKEKLELQHRLYNSIPQNVDPALEEKVQRDIVYHQERLDVAYMERDILFTAMDAKADVNR